VVRDQSIQRHVVVSPILSRALAREGGVRPLKGGAEVSASGVSRSLSAAEALSPEERSARFGLTLSEADLLLPALMVLRHFLELAGANRVLLTDVDLLTGLLGDIAMELGGVDPRAAFVAEIVGSARGIARRYGAKTAHAEHVRRIALDLFDSLRAFLDLDPRDRLLMEVAAVLHDVGRFINDRDHHKHGMYVVGWSEIIGLDERSRNVVALLVRYHRKGRPKVQHVEFGSLPTEERLRVSKLAAVLRMADAMDRGHEQRVGRIEARVRETALEIVAESAGDLSVEIAAIERKGNLFEDLTGLKVSLRRAVW
jgi:exopolyphosphatase/guanosine-5'-triphosphate,3'-diphosphate pyrophosphatase